MRTEKEINSILKLKNEGKNNTEISKLLDIPRTTIITILNKKSTNIVKKQLIDNSKNYILNNNLEKEYSYILGLYLGDGHIVKMKRTFRLRIFLDKKYDDLNNYVKRTLELLFPNNKVTINKTKINMIIINVYSNNLINLFPQHGAGKKHNRSIVLEDWQRDVIVPDQIIKGLIHSDGSYFYSGIYDRYEFKNSSSDILSIFKIYSNKLNLKYTEQKKVITFYKREDVLKLKTIIGTKINIII